MLTLDQFVQQHTGKFLDFDGSYGPQCVDVIEYYARDVLGLPTLWGNAVDIFGEMPAHYTWVKNRYGDKSQVPPKGAIVVWGSDVRVGTGVYGHIAINLSANGDSFMSFDQNWPEKSPCHVQSHNYIGVIGWGTPKPVAAGQPLPVFGLATVSFGQWLHGGRQDLKGHAPLELLGEYLREAYPGRNDLQANGRNAGDWLQQLLGELVREAQPSP